MYLNHYETITRHGINLCSELSGEIDPFDYCEGDDTRGVVCYDGNVSFEVNGVEYYIFFSAAWYEDDTFDYWEEGDMRVRKASDDDEYLTAEEVTTIENAFGGAVNVYQALLDAMAKATEAAKPRAMQYLKDCIDNGDF